MDERTCEMVNEAGSEIGNWLREQFCRKLVGAMQSHRSGLCFEMKKRPDAVNGSAALGINRKCGVRILPKEYQLYQSRYPTSPDSP